MGRKWGRKKRVGCLSPPPLLFLEAMSAAASSASFHSAGDEDLSIMGDTEVIFLNQVIHHSSSASSPPEESWVSEIGERLM